MPFWRIQFLQREGAGLVGHYERFRNIYRLDPGIWGVREHFRTCVALGQLLLVFRMDGSNLVSVEVLFRWLQAIEYVHVENAKDQESNGMDVSLSLEEQAAFSGASMGHAAIMFRP